MILTNLAGAFTCEGFIQKEGRNPDNKDAGFIPGPVHILCDRESVNIIGIFRGRIPADPYGGKIINGTGLVATPGFIDTHTHLRFSGNMSDKTASNCSDEEIRLILEDRLKEFLLSGTTTVEVRTGYSCNLDDGLRCLKILNSLRSRKDLPDVLPTFEILHRPLAGKTGISFMENVKAILTAIAKDKMAEFIDIFPVSNRFTHDDVIMFFDLAGKYGLKMKVQKDKSTPDSIYNTLIHKGALSIDHFLHIPSEGISRFFRVKTVITLQPSASFRFNMEYLNARCLIDNGVRVALSTDYNPEVAPFMRMQLTMLLAAYKLNMKPCEILCATTYNAAAAIGRESCIGTLTQHKLADILCWRVSGSPTFEGEDILEKIIASQLSPSIVMHAGKVLYL